MASRAVAQLAERLLLMPEIRGSKPLIGKILYWIYLLLAVENTKIKKKEAGIGPNIKIRIVSILIWKEPICYIKQMYVIRCYFIE